MTNTTTSKRAVSRRKLWARIVKRKYSYLMLVPVAVYFIIFKYTPMWGLVIAFQDYQVFKGILGSPWVGLQNFAEFLQGRMFWRVIRNTLVLNVISFFFTFPAPILFALMLNEVRQMRFRRAVQTITYMPHFISTVVLVSMVHGLFSPTNGIVNQLLMRLGSQPIYFLNRSDMFRSLMIGSGLWQGTGWNSIIYLAAIASIDPSFYEAARIDGATRLQQIRYITLPCILGTVMIMFILRMGQMLNSDFEKAFLMQTPGNKSVSELISTYVYDRGVRASDYGYATAVSLFNSIISFGLILLSNHASKKVTSEGLW